MSGHLDVFTLDAPKDVLKRLRLYRYRQRFPFVACRRPSSEAGSDPASLGDLRGYCDCDLDLFGLGFLAQRQADRQHTGLVLGVDLAWVDRRRERERPHERAVTALDAMEVLLRDCRVELLLATQRECVVFNRHLELILLHVGELSLQHELMLAVAVNVDRRYPRAAGDVFLRTDVEALEHPAHSLLQRGHITGRIPANDSHDDSPVLIPSVAVTPLRRSRGTGIRHADRECHDGKALVRAVAQGREGFPGEVRQYSGKRGV